MTAAPPSPALLVFVALLAAPPPATPAAASPPERRADVSEDFVAILADGDIVVAARPVEGETPKEFARRITRDEAAARDLLAIPDGVSRARLTFLPYAALSDEARRSAIRALFPSDLRATSGWIHIPVADEPLAAVAEWFTGSTARASAVAKANALGPGPVPRGTAIRIPVELLLPPFRDAEAVEDEEPPRLEYGQDPKGRFAVYRLKPREALYSAVVVRFTGRLHAEDVVQLALKIAERSGIEDVHAIPVGYPVKIPLEYLSEEFLPKEDPRAQELVREKAESAQFSAPAKARGLEGVRVVIDAGHGGRDTGTLHAGIQEATYVYDVACRLRKILAERTKADVVMTTREPEVGWETPDRDRLANRKTRLLLTDPPYRLEDPALGVNLRWYLANSLLDRPTSNKRRIPPDKTVFVSIHADSLHPSVRGAMVYVPGERFLRERYGRNGSAYQPYREWRERPVVSFARKERVAAEGVSTALAEKLLSAMRASGLPIHRFSPVRTHVIRGGREWVPAVLRYNRIPNRVLLEISNLGNEEDRELTITREFRRRVAEAVAAGLVEFFGGDGIEAPTGAKPVRRAAKAAESPARELPGPWPWIYGPLPEIRGPWPEPQGPWPALFGPPAPSRPDRRM